MNIIKILITFLIVCFVNINIFSQSTNRQYIGYKQDLGSIIIKVSDGEYKIEPFNKKIFHVTFLPSGESSKDLSFAVIKKPEKLNFRITDEGNSVKIESYSLKVIVKKQPFALEFYRHSKLLFADNSGYIKTDSSQIINLTIDKSEVLYGGGTRVLGMNRRGNRLKLYNKAHYGYETHSDLMNYSMPIFISSKKYMVLFDNSSSAFLDLDSKHNNTVSYESKYGTINYYLVTGKDWFEILEQYTDLTGHQPLPPLWAFGNFSSRFGYHSQKEVLNTIDKFFEDNIPVEAVIIDIYWFGKGIFGSMGNLDWYRDSFPEPYAMIDKLNKKGVKTILVTEPFILTTSNRWKEAVDNKILATDSTGNPYTYDFYFGHTGLIDIFKPDAQQWFWNIYKDLTTKGIGGWWGDLGEPEVHPSELMHVNGCADEVHNVYGHEWTRLIYEGYAKDFSQQRPFILMRAGYAGTQRYGIIPWTGDVNRTWGGLKPQPELSLQMGMQGIAYMHSDLGGFAGGKKINNELYIRWLQYGVFQPIFRPHAQEHIPSESVFQSVDVTASAKRSIELRYKMLPYIYSMAFENNRTGKPLMYPLFFIEQQNRNLLTYDNAYMWGDALLVSPIKSQGVTSQKIYLPQGYYWTNFYTGKKYEGGQEINVSVTIDNIPVFARGGEFLPMLNKVTQTKDYNLNEFTIHFYPDIKVRNSGYSLYNDDGITNKNYEKGFYEILNFTAVNTEKLLTINVEREIGKKYNNKREENSVTFIIHNLEKKPKKIIINGQKYQEKPVYNSEKKSVSFNTSIKNYKKNIEIYY
jgi:alpha-glucosidase (family GH31 glycosyl hydrolase)